MDGSWPLSPLYQEKGVHRRRDQGEVLIHQASLAAPEEYKAFCSMITRPSRRKRIPLAKGVMEHSRTIQALGKESKRIEMGRFTPCDLELTAQVYDCSFG